MAISGKVQFNNIILNHLIILSSFGKLPLLIKMGGVNNKKKEIMCFIKSTVVILLFH